MEDSKKAKLPDAEDIDEGNEASEEEREEKIVQLWVKRFEQSKNFRRPYLEKNLRMYKLYRAYRDARNYAYGTNLMPPTGFEIIETVKPRLASAKIKVNIYPKKAADQNNKNGISKWDDLVEYNLQEMEFDDKKVWWINAQLMFGNGIAQVYWDGKTANMEIVDNWLFYPDPKAGNRLKNSRWEIKQAFKSKAVIENDEEKRGENRLYDEAKLKKVKDEQPTGDDPRRDRYQINTLKMGQIDDGRQKKSDIQSSRGESSQDKEYSERTVEIWECWDHVENKLQTIMNRKYLVRDDEHPYSNVNKGQVFIDLPDIALNWEFYAMGHLEPVETVIHEIADSRNQAMDDIVFSLDPIRKVKKGKGYKDEDIKHSPGAIWYLLNADDVVIERGPEISRAWVEKDNLLRREIQTSLALSEYTQGLPQSSQEPANKVEMLLMQTNIRFSGIVRQYEIALTELANAIIELNQEFLEEDLAMRILGKNFRFAEFSAMDKQMSVDAWVSIDPVKEKSVEQEAKEAVELYKMLVTDDKPDGGNPEEVRQWKKKKALLQRVIVGKFGYEEYEDILAPAYQDSKPKENIEELEAPQPGPEGGMKADNPASVAETFPQPEPLLPPEEMAAPAAQSAGAGFLGGLFSRK